MARFLFSTILANDLGVPIRSLPIALELKRRGHAVAFCNNLSAPSKLIKKAAVDNLPLKFGKDGFPSVFPPPTPELWNLDHLLCQMGHLDEKHVAELVRVFIDVIQRFKADVVVDSFMPTACVAARASGKPLVTIIQADLHPTNKGFMWWKPKPDDVPSAVPALNAALLDHGLMPISRISELVVGDLTLCAGIPETDPVPLAPDVVHLGPMFGAQLRTPLPAWVEEFGRDRPLVWVYCGNPRYIHADIAAFSDSIVVLRTAFEGLADENVGVVATAGFQEIPKALPPLPDNFRTTSFLPGFSLAKRCNLMVHHGGHGSCMTGVFSGTPALILPTYSERESNARRLVALGVAEQHVPFVDGS
ncbi:MAG: hypothetical protein GY866_13515, partial [Proteobacteria bacterium]|nr:hypothetical protein [Pseudomonadota bacterium]